MSAFALAILASTAKAADPPPRPDVPEPVEGQCAETHGLDRGDPIPGWLVSSSGGAACSAIVVPLSSYEDLLLTEAWAEHVAKRYTLDTMALEWKLEWYQAELTRASEPTPLIERTGTIVAMGAVIGIVGVMSSAWALQAVGE